MPPASCPPARPRTHHSPLAPAPPALRASAADLSKLKDQAHLQKPQRGQWAVMLVPEAPKPPSKKQAAAAAGSAPAAEADGGGAAAELA